MNKTRFKLKLLALSLPAIAGFFIFFILPFFTSVGYSFIDNTFNENFVGIDNYIKIWNNKYFQLALKNTFIFSGISVILIISISLLLSIGLLKLSKKFELLKSAFILPMILPTASIIVVWQLLFGGDNYFELTKLNGVGDFFIMLPIYLLFIWKNTGINIILITAAISKLPKDIIEAASLDGKVGFKVHMKVTFPLILPTMFFVTVLSFVNSLKIFKESYLFFGTNYPPDPAYMVQYYMNNHFFKLNYQNLATGVVIFTFIIAMIIFAIYIIENSYTKKIY